MLIATSAAIILFSPPCLYGIFHAALPVAAALRLLAAFFAILLDAHLLIAASLVIINTFTPRHTRIHYHAAARY